ncbi:MAG: hypothetical protein ACO3A2_02750 [Bdellovibrionia bacterium]
MMISSRRIGKTKRIRLVHACISLLLFSSALSFAGVSGVQSKARPSKLARDPSSSEPLDLTLKPEDNEVSASIFRDMGVVQRKAMNKRNRFLFSSYGSLDFSDGPYTNYFLSFNPGYAISDFFEIYLQVSPVYFVSQRGIVNLISSLRLQNGEVARVTSANPQFQYGVELLWAPLYGKDSFGISKIIRSDTFLKLGASQIKYDLFTGLGFKLGLGKTFFLGKSAGLRFCADYAWIQSLLNEEKSFRTMFLVEFGLNFYI